MVQGINVDLQEDVVTSMQARNRGQEPDGWMAAREVNRLYMFYADALKEVKLTSGEACLVCDMLNGILVDEWSVMMLWADAEDAIRFEGLDEKWEVDGPMLVAKLKGLNRIQGMALVDASDQFWSDKDQSDIRVKVNSYFGIK